MLQDIEDFPRKCGGTCQKATNESLHLKFKDGSEWYKVYSIDEILNLFKNSNEIPYMLLAGNTADGWYHGFLCSENSSFYCF